MRLFQSKKEIPKRQDDSLQLYKTMTEQKLCFEAGEIYFLYYPMLDKLKLELDDLEMSNKFQIKGSRNKNR